MTNEETIKLLQRAEAAESKAAAAEDALRDLAMFFSCGGYNDCDLVPFDPAHYARKIKEASIEQNRQIRIREHRYDKKAMSKLTITDNVKAEEVQVQVGQFYKDTGRFGNNGIYIVARFYNSAGLYEFALVELSTGVCYTTATLKIVDIFNKDAANFKLIENVEIIIS